MFTRSDCDSFTNSELLGLVLGHQEQIERLQKQLAEAQAEIARLRAENESLRRRPHRQAAPFSHNTPSTDPKPSGRKPGKGRFRHREPPPPDSVNTEVADAPVSEPVCPRCGGALGPEQVEEATTLELPKEIKLTLRRFRVGVCRCQQCGKSVRGSHPELAPDQFGASAHRLGPGLRALCHYLHFGLGVTQRKVPKLIHEVFGATLTQGALCQDALKQSQREVGACYEQLRQSVRESGACYHDDTSWRIGGRSAWLSACDTDLGVVYQIRMHHRNEEVRELIPSDYPGVLTSDRGPSYDAKELALVRQQKCLSHLIRSCSAVLDGKRGKSRWFAERLKRLLREAISLWHERALLSGAEYVRRRDELVWAVTYHLRDRALSERDNQRLLSEVGWHQDRGSVLRFLLDPDRLEPTNNRAERALRPAVIGRKVSHCSKSAEGADAYCAFMSVIQTLRKQGQDCLLDVLSFLVAAPARAPAPG